MAVLQPRRNRPTTLAELWKESHRALGAVVLEKHSDPVSPKPWTDEATPGCFPQVRAEYIHVGLLFSKAGIPTLARHFLRKAMPARHLHLFRPAGPTTSSSTAGQGERHAQ